MPYHLFENETLEAGMKRLAREQVERAIGEIDDRELGPHETVHQVRKRCKKVRALVRLVRPWFEDTYCEENAWYRDSAKPLSGIRDCQSQIECYDDLMEHFSSQVNRQQFGTIRGALTRQRNRLEGVGRLLAMFRERMVAGLERVEQWPLENVDFEAVIGGLRKTYGRGRRAMCAAYEAPKPESFHEWRKRTKYHWYHMRVLRDIWGPLMRRRRDEADRLGDYLGDDRDLVVLRRTICAKPDEYGKERDLQAITGLIDRRREELELEARSLGMRLFAEGKQRFVDRMRTYWEAWCMETTSTAAIAHGSLTAEVSNR